MSQAQQLAAEQEIEFIWQCCGEQEFAVQDFAHEYYGRTPQAVEVAALSLALHSAPIYFHRKGKGRYKAAPQEILQAALAGQEKRRQQQAQIAAWCEQLLQHQCPAEWNSVLGQLIYAPDKNTPQWKALDQAAQQAKCSPIRLLDQAGAIASHEEFHFGAFVREFFPEGTEFPQQVVQSLDDIQSPASPLQALLSALPRAETPAFSIDDSTTTEIDDAFSVKALADGYLIGIHIAAPALAIAPDTPLDEVVQTRLSTVYMPGRKITMLPEPLVQQFSLDEGHWRPALSLYLQVDAQFNVLQHESRIEQVLMQDNLRHDQIEPYFNADNCMQDSGHAYWSKLNVLYQLALKLEQQRGKADSAQNQQRDYSFYVQQGHVRIVERQRGTPLDKLVAELMIAVNQTWGADLAEKQIVAIYRAQQTSKVYMTLRAEPHQGLGVAQYAWSSSPLRRAIDLFNQRQLISLLQNSAAPYQTQDQAIGAVMRKFDVVYQQYRDFQTRMERYWCLQYIRQEQLQTLTGVVWRDNLVRLDGLPYICKVSSLPNLPSGSHVSLQVQSIDTLDLLLHTRFVAHIAGDVAALDLDEEEQAMLLPVDAVATQTDEVAQLDEAAQPDAAAQAATDAELAGQTQQEAS
jgi:exoribonuclease-2